MSVWPANAIDRQYDTDETRRAAMAYVVGGWIECLPRNLEQHFSLLLRRIPASCGRNFWHHQTPDYDPAWIDGAPAIRGRNSWSMDWPKPGAGGWFILQGSKMYADDITAPATALAS